MNYFAFCFQSYDWKVEKLEGENNYVASKESLVVFFSPLNNTASAVSFLSCSKDKILQDWRKQKIRDSVGVFAYKNGRKYDYFGQFYNHDYSLGEIGFLLK